MSGLNKDNRYKSGLAFVVFTVFILLCSYFIFNMNKIEENNKNEKTNLVSILEDNLNETFSEELIKKIDHVESLYNHRIFTIRSDVLKALSEDSNLAEEMLLTFLDLENFENKDAFDNLVVDINNKTKLSLTEKQISLIEKANRIKLLQIEEAGLMMVVNLSKVLEREPKEIAYILYKNDFLSK